MSTKRCAVASFALVLLTQPACGPISGAAQRRVERASIVAKPARSVTPTDVGIPYRQVWIEHHGRRLEGWLVLGADSVRGNSAVFICHGTGETLSDWVHAQARLRENGISSFVFDYSGFGNSTGTPSAAALEQDVRAAYDSFTAMVAKDTRRVALGFSLGTGVLLAAQDELKPAPDAIVLASAFSTARSAAVRRRFYPGILAYLAPDTLWNNLVAIRTVKVPLLIVHGDKDGTFPLSMATQLAAASGQRNSLLVQQGYPHNALYKSATSDQWRSIMEFIRTGQRTPTPQR